ncbi:RNA polymerase sigma factor [Paenibacillus brasilensis]|uniref:RNA polymerase sigma-70 factor (ECF subfamily) n=1 Tax=Paenibacillus brasilensis TaxID=128574 RepID=A0ABU0L159_9BACL|nr:RNA polymerase sigma factor [Paenibacillus brasilensis]MDQ0494094.1 RNA polymerase sigma-70 factor (ECF subfamily) [Paenibacillus brasilensis]
MESNRELFDLYQRDVYRTCYYMVHNASDAEDLTQEVFITLFRSHREHIGQLKAWIMKITVNHCLNYLKRRNSLHMKVSSNPHLFTGTESKPVDRQVEERESAEEWAAYMNRLPAKIRAVLTLRYMHDFTLAEISELLAIPLGTVKSRAHKGLRLMERILRDAGAHIPEMGGENYEQRRKSIEAQIK